MKTKKRKRIETIEQKIISNYILLGQRPRAAFKRFELFKMQTELNYININS